VRQAEAVTAATVVLCPPLPGASAAYDAADTADELLDRPGGWRVLSPYVDDPSPEDDARTQRAHWVAHLSIALAAGNVVAPVLLVVDGTAGALAPALGFSQKAARRAVSGYVLVDAVVPPADDRSLDWPDAPVVYVASPAADEAQTTQARLRGWDVVEVVDAAPATVAAAIAEVAGR
jgi:hypothetical protein